MFSRMLVPVIVCDDTGMMPTNSKGTAGTSGPVSHGMSSCLFESSSDATEFFCLPTNNRITNALKMAASTLRTSNTYLGAQSRRLRTKLGSPVAIKALAANLARMVYRMLRYGMKYVDQGDKIVQRDFWSTALPASALGAMIADWGLLFRLPASGSACAPSMRLLSWLILLLSLAVPITILGEPRLEINGGGSSG
jgi:hypothetical protein